LLGVQSAPLLSPQIKSGCIEYKFIKHALTLIVELQMGIRFFHLTLLVAAL
jgi:hypothetical protein